MPKSKKTTKSKTTTTKTSKTSNKSAKSRKRAKADDVQIAEATVLEQTPDTTADTMPAEAETAAPAKKGRAKKTASEPKPKKVSGLDAAYEVLKASGEPMSSQAIVDAMFAKGLWKTNGKTPAATIYSAMIREIDDKPGESRFTKTGRGLFAAA